MDVSICIVKDILNTFSELHGGQAWERSVDHVYNCAFKGFDPYNLRIVGKTDLGRSVLPKQSCFDIYFLINVPTGLTVQRKRFHCSWQGFKPQRSNNVYKVVSLKQLQ